MKKIFFAFSLMVSVVTTAQTGGWQPTNSGLPKYTSTAPGAITQPPAKKWQPPKAKKTYWKPVFRAPAPPAANIIPIRNVVYQYIDTANKNAENFFPSTGNIGIGTNTPGAAMEIRRSAGNGDNKNFLLKLSNNWASDGLNEPTIMFSNGDDGEASSYWTLGARVSGDNSHTNPQVFKIGYKAPKESEEHEFFSIDSYQGRVKIGSVNTNFDGYKLYVEEGILTEKIKVAVKNTTEWFDHVFNDDYKLMPLTDLEKYIGENKHLPDIPTTKEVMENGVDLGKTNALLLKKVEELTLYLIELKKEIDKTKKEVEDLKQNKRK